MKTRPISRREFLGVGVGIATGSATASLVNPLAVFGQERAVVSIARIENDNTAAAVEKALDLLGGIGTVAKGKERIMLKPNLVGDTPTYTTKPAVIRALAQLMQNAGREVLVGEGSAWSPGFNIIKDQQYRTKSRKILDEMQQHVFDTLGYTDLARSMGIPLVNLHSGEMVEVDVPGGLASDRITLHRSLTDIDLLCSVPMMKTHVFAGVTLGMKNLIGLYPGTVYQAPRSLVHNSAAKAGSPGVAFEVLDMVRANKLGLVVVDASWSMEGNGPAWGTEVKTDLIIAGTNPLGTDMVAANMMGFEPSQVPTFTRANQIGMSPTSLAEIEIRGEALDAVKGIATPDGKRRPFAKPGITRWSDVAGWWAAEELVGTEDTAVPGASWGEIKAKSR